MINKDRTEHFGQVIGDSITTNKTLKPFTYGTPSLSYAIEEFTDSGIECPKCKEGELQRNNTIVCTSNPPMYEYRCKVCGSTCYRFE